MVHQNAKKGALLQKDARATPMADKGRREDDEVAHVAEREVVLPASVRTPEFMTYVRRHFERMGVPIERYTVQDTDRDRHAKRFFAGQQGDENMNRNTGAQQFYAGKGTSRKRQEAPSKVSRNPATGAQQFYDSYEDWSRAQSASFSARQSGNDAVSNAILNRGSEMDAGALDAVEESGGDFSTIKNRSRNSGVNSGLYDAAKADDPNQYGESAYSPENASGGTYSGNRSSGSSSSSTSRSSASQASSSNTSAALDAFNSAASGGSGGSSNPTLQGGAYDPPDNGGFSPENAGETIDQAYGNFFNRQADQAGREFWVDQLNSGAYDSRGEFREAFLGGAEANQPGGTYNAKSGQWEGTTDDQRRFMNDQFYDREVERPLYADVTQNWATGRVNEGQGVGDSSIERAFNLQFYRDPTEAGFDRFSDQTGSPADLNAAVLSGAQGDDRQIARDRYARNDRGEDYEDPFAGGQSVADTFAAYADNPDGQFYTDEQLGNVAQTANRAQFYGDGKFAGPDGTLYEYPEGVGSGDANMFSRDGFEEMLAQLPEGQKRSLAAAFGQYSTRTPEVSQALEGGTYNVRRS